MTAGLTPEATADANAEAQAIDLVSPVPAECWRALRGWLDRLGVDYEPNLHDELGLTGYAVRLRNYLLGIGLGVRSTGPALTLTAVLCRGMDRPQVALAAVDRANGQVRLGQVLFFPGPPAELSFFATWSFDLLDEATFALLFDAVLAELNDVGFPAVMAVRGYHPTDQAAPWADPELQAEAPEAPDASDGEPPADTGTATGTSASNEAGTSNEAGGSDATSASGEAGAVGDPGALRDPAPRPPTRRRGPRGPRRN
ncbi:MAG: hypothetical protein EXR79_07445 [Myxococcales bacterium]|nr:hypothetical protein [Myxococcales bacterium]